VVGAGVAAGAQAARIMAAIIKILVKSQNFLFIFLLQEILVFDY
jgi:hypothetical protein